MCEDLTAVTVRLTVISDYGRDADETCALLEHYA
jgi:hypothetical protein